ncbi:MAG: hypothetical protein V3U67_05300 [Gemmatimonadota bacterium]
MVRSVAAVIIGYLAMVVFVMITMTLAWKLTGPSFAFQEGSTHVTGSWVAVSLALGVPAAILGGWVCRAMALRSKPVTVLAWLVLVVGVGMAIAHMSMDTSLEEQRAAGAQISATDTRTPAELTSFEASSEAVQPTWYNFSIALVGFAGVLLGGHLRERNR